jgi:hypothetical protein
LKFSELVNLIRDYEDATWSPTALGIKFGCDCGCGGDAYTAESWDEAEQDAADAVVKAKEFCTKWGFDWRNYWVSCPVQSTSLADSHTM